MAEMVALHELARAMQVTPKTLNRWLEIAQITPIEAPHDRRKRLVSQEQVGQIKALFGVAESSGASAVESQLRELREQVGALQTELAQMHAWVASVADNVTALAQRSLASEQEPATYRAKVASEEERGAHSYRMA
jgi:DNA-binding transcriptional MerR regulator